MGNSRSYKDISDLIESCQGHTLSREERLRKTIKLASLLLELTNHETKGIDKIHEEKLAKMMKDPQGKAFTTAMTDQCFRTSSFRRTASQLSFLIKKYGIPRFLPPLDRFKFFLFKHLGTLVPHLFVPLAKIGIRQEIGSVLLPDDPLKQKAYFERCWEEEIKVNLNHLGEAILGEKEAKSRLTLYLNDLESPFIDYISIKVSTLYSQINLLAWEKSLEILAERLKALYMQAMKYPVHTKQGTQEPKFVNLDMEEYRDLDITIALFKLVLSAPEFKNLSAGIVLQSYLPDAFEKQKEITKWAMARVDQGGAPIKLRLVKGANLSMEHVESSLKGWREAPYLHKIEADANFKRMLEYGADKTRAQAVHLGIGSHNLFDISYTLILRAERMLENEISFEMLQGMATPMRRTVQKVAQGMLLYSPEAKEENFQYAIAYLIRRLDENTGEENFLRHLFGLSLQNPEWANQAAHFQKGAELIDTLYSEKRRNQNRLEPIQKKDPKAPFSNEPETDFALEGNRKWVKKIIETYENKHFDAIPLVIGGKEIVVNLQGGIDPSNPSKLLYKYASADIDLIDKALEVAKAAEKKWQETSIEQRSALLAKAEQLLRQKRADLMGVMLADSGKILQESDVEICEAIDFVEYYRKNWEKVVTFSDVGLSAKGTILVAPPWNFPCSIPTGGIAASLMAGNCVLFKPAPETILVGWTLVQAFWEAGIPKDVLQFINCPDEPTGSGLIQDKRLDGVVLTGATQTARHLLNLRPGLCLIAETGGKNAMILSSLCDRDLAIKDLLQSAFGHSGQKCSACSLAIIEAPLYNDPSFLEALQDAAASLPVGSAWDPSTKIGPLIQPPKEALKRGLTELEPRERWLLMPRKSRQNPHLWTPGIKLDVEWGSYTHQTELFGPLLGLVCAEDLEEALKIANATPYGLTSGIHTLDEREKEFWKQEIVAGNLYINRGITGAIVRRQPFGGHKASYFGPGQKAGGPNYVLQFATLTQQGLPKERKQLPKEIEKLTTLFSFSKEEREFLVAASESYAYWASLLQEPKDASGILGQENLFYHVPLEKMVLRVSQSDRLSEAMAIVIACYFCKTPLTISTNHPDLEKQKLPAKVVFQSEAVFQANVFEPRIRLLQKPLQPLLEIAAKRAIYLIDTPVLASGRFELLHYMREVSLSHDIHRYGYLPEKP